jgi:hypothetical protein
MPPRLPLTVLPIPPRPFPTPRTRARTPPHICRMNSVFVFAALLAAAAADFIQTAYFNGDSCLGRRTSLSFSSSLGLNGCAYRNARFEGVTCISTTSANLSTYTNGYCNTPASSSTPIPSVGVCTPVSGGGSIFQTCVSGTFLDPAPLFGGVVVTSFSAPGTCPVTSQARDLVTWIPARECTSDGMRSRKYTCSAAGASFSLWDNANCNGAPSQTSSIPLGCSLPGSNASQSGPQEFACTDFQPAPYLVTSLYAIPDSFRCTCDNQRIHPPVRNRPH